MLPGNRYFMSDTVKIADLGIQINFPAWERFNLEELTNDGVVLFQYLAFHCQNIIEWTHSDSDILAELGIKRSRLATLRDKLSGMGILETRVTLNQYDNKITAYRLLYAEIAKPENLKLLYREVTPSGSIVDLVEYSRLYKQLAAAQPKKGIKPGSKNASQSTSQQWAAKTFASHLEQVYAGRVAMMNRSRKAGDKKIPGTVKFSPKHIQSLSNVLRHFDNDKEYIENAFTAFADTLLSQILGQSSEMLTVVPRSPLNYFLSYSNKVTSDEDESEADGQKYAVIYKFGEYFAARYTQG